MSLKGQVKSEQIRIYLIKIIILKRKGDFSETDCE